MKQQQMELTKKQTERQDFVDNAIFELMQSINPMEQELEWNIEIIGEVRDVIGTYFEEKFNGFFEQDFYPYIEE